MCINLIVTLHCIRDYFLKIRKINEEWPITYQIDFVFLFVEELYYKKINIVLPVL